MADDDTPIAGSPTDTADVTTSTHASASTPPLNISSMRSFKAVTTSTEPVPAPASISIMTSLKKRLRRIIVVIILAANK